METRRSLAPYVGQRVTVIAYFDKFSQHFDPPTQQYRVTALVQEIFLDGARVSTHTYVQGAIVFEKYGPQHGERIQFSARVSKYQNRHYSPTGRPVYEDRYGLEFPDDIVFLDRTRDAAASD
jgi:hypothetical protein